MTCLPRVPGLRNKGNRRQYRGGVSDRIRKLHCAQGWVVPKCVIRARAPIRRTLGRRRQKLCEAGPVCESGSPLPFAAGPAMVCAPRLLGLAATLRRQEDLRGTRRAGLWSLFAHEFEHFLAHVVRNESRLACFLRSTHCRSVHAHTLLPVLVHPHGKAHRGAPHV